MGQTEVMTTGQLLRLAAEVGECGRGWGPEVGVRG